MLSTVGGVVLRIGDRIEVLREDGIPTRVIFDKVPENLRAQSDAVRARRTPRSP